MRVFVCVIADMNIIEVFDTVENAKATWITTYSTMPEKVTFGEVSSKGISIVKYNNVQVGIIVERTLLTSPDHL